MSQLLAPDELSQLEACERVIERARSAFTEAGRSLRDIRDGKLYRASHDTFEAYCRERWGYSRSRAYELIDQAGVVADIETATGAVLSDASDISAREVKAIKARPEAIAELKERVEAGEEPAAALRGVVDLALAERQPAAPIPPTAPAPRLSSTPPDLADKRQDRIEELEATVEDLTEENAKLKAKIAALEPMRLEYERGGFAEVIAGLGEQIRVLKTRVESESQDKVKNLRSAEYWKRKAIEAGYSNHVVIDLETLEEVKHG